VNASGPNQSGCQQQQPADQRNDGFIVILVDIICHVWIRFVALWGWARFHKKENCSPPETRADVFDRLHSLLLVLAIVAFGFCFWSEVPWMYWSFYGFGVAFAGFRTVDLMITSLALVTFGNKHGDHWLIPMTMRRRRRTLLLVLVEFVELTFWYAVLYFHLGTSCKVPFKGAIACPQQAFQTSISTITTIGYGTYAPVGGWAIFFATLEVLTGILLLGGLFASLVSVTLAVQGDGGAQTNGSRFSVTDPSCCWSLRKWLPPVLTLVLVLVAYWLLVAHAWPLA